MSEGARLGILCPPARFTKIIGWRNDGADWLGTKPGDKGGKGRRWERVGPVAVQMHTMACAALISAAPGERCALETEREA
jgi:hypothetical protein